MNDKNKKRILISIIGVLGIIIVYLLLKPLPILNTTTNSSYVNSGSSNVQGTCSDGSSYRCTTTCTNYPTKRTTIETPTDSTTCRTHSSSEGYSASKWDMNIATSSDCSSYVMNNACSVPKDIELDGNCCMWSC
jgi:hypothetical protein